ncbi:GAF domain-containing protein [Tumebacillus sp. ITR2]|uniref:GAF domain-containing protein n=1 Tax=Tumebacillus amylolyticus TaxID=2801339 RepID=A0ABS1JEG9_9BACL|nr:GAF domain-containing protein [Tumebacillus amylolyticus]
MIRQGEEIQKALDGLRLQVGVDFLALAIAEGDGQIRWVNASGNRNDRFKRIVLRPGKGIAGRVITLGRPIVVEGIVPKAGDDPREYPILLAEGLCCAVAVPVVCGSRVRGVLLMASRTERSFATSDVDAVLGLAERLGTVYSEV